MNSTPRRSSGEAERIDIGGGSIRISSVEIGIAAAEADGIVFHPAAQCRRLVASAGAVKASCKVVAFALEEEHPAIVARAARGPVGGENRHRAEGIIVVAFLDRAGGVHERSHVELAVLEHVHALGGRVPLN